MVNNAAMFSRVEVTTLSDEELVRGIVTNVKDSRLVDELWNRTNTAIAAAAKVAASKGASIKTYLRTKIGYHFLEMVRKGAIQKVRTKPYGEECEEDDDGRPCYGASYGDVCKVVSKKYDHKYRERELVDAYSQVRSLVTVAKHRECLDLLMEAYSLGERKPVQYVADGLGCSRQQVYNILRQVKSQVPGSLAAEVKNIL